MVTLKSSNSNPIKKPKTVKEVKDDISMSNVRHEHLRNTIFYWFILCLLMIVISCVVGLFLYKFFTDSEIQTFVLNQIKDNIVFILISSFAILKIPLSDTNKWS